MDKTSKILAMMEAASVRYIGSDTIYWHDGNRWSSPEERAKHNDIALSVDYDTERDGRFSNSFSFAALEGAKFRKNRIYLVDVFGKKVTIECYNPA